MECMKREEPKNERGDPKRLSVWDFISIVSHQLRNPLASTKLSLEMFLTGELGPLTPDQEEYLKMMRSDNERMVRLVKEFLTISSIELGEIQLNPVEFDIKELTTDVVTELHIYAAAHNAKILYRTGDAIPRVTGDKLKIRQVTSNFIDNAIKYSQPGDAIEIRLDLTSDGKNVIFEVKDHGIGIPKNEQENIFSKFYRASNATSVHPEGAGVGLYVAKAIIEKSGGSIDFESEEEKGSRFWFTLPVSSTKETRRM